jgi:hypothetical protein
MMKISLRMTLTVAIIAVAFAVAGCGVSSGGSTSGITSNTGSLTKGDHDAIDATMADLQRHFQKGSDGWTTSIYTGGYAPDRFLRQYRDLAIDEVDAQDLSQSDQMNGFQWVGKITFKKTACREAGGQSQFVLDGMAEGQQAYVQKAPGHWTQWVDFTPGPLTVAENKGHWQVQYDASYLRGQMPTPTDFSAAGVR